MSFSATQQIAMRNRRTVDLPLPVAPMTLSVRGEADQRGVKGEHKTYMIDTSGAFSSRRGIVRS